MRRKDESRLHDIIVKTDKAYTAANLSCIEEYKARGRTTTDRLEQWKQKSLHGRHPAEIEKEHIDKKTSLLWLQKGYLFPETEGFIMAIQDEVIRTRNYRKYILKEPEIVHDLCRMCNKQSETIQHLVAGCEKLAPVEYKDRHDKVAKILHSVLAKQHKLAQKVSRYFEYEPDKILENDEYIIYWDRTLLTHKTVHHNRPDITVVDKRRREAKFIDIAVVNTSNVQKTLKDKYEKYIELKEAIRTQWNLKAIQVIPIVISATGVVPTQTVSGIKGLIKEKHWQFHVLKEQQKAAILSTTSTIRRIMADAY